MAAAAAHSPHLNAKEEGSWAAAAAYNQKVLCNIYKTLPTLLLTLLKKFFVYIAQKFFNKI